MVKYNFIKKHFTTIAIILTIMVGCLVLANWIFRSSIFNVLLPGKAPMKFNTALCFILTGIALLLINQPNISRSRKMVSNLCIGMVLFFISLTIIEYIFGWNLGIDELLLSSRHSKIISAFPGRINPITSVYLFLISIILIFIREKKYHWPIQAILFIILPGPILAIFNHLFGNSFLGFIPQLAAITMPSAFLIILLCLGIFFCRHLRYIKFNFQKQIAFFLILISFILGILFFAFNTNSLNAKSMGNAIKINQKVLLLTEEANTRVFEMQSSLSAYIITGTPDYLSQFENLSDTIQKVLNNLIITVERNKSQQKHIDSLQTFIQKFISSGNELINIRKLQGREIANNSFQNINAKFWIDKIGATHLRIEEEENRVMAILITENEMLLKNSSRLIVFFQIFAFSLLLAAFTLIYKNTNKRNKAEEALHKSLSELSDYQFALDESSIVAITDQRGFIRQVNDNFCKISKFRREELVGKDFSIINSKHHPKLFIKDLWITISMGRVWKGELKNRAKDGSFYWVDTTIVPFINEYGKTYQYVSIASDTTHRNNLEVEILQFNKVLQEKIEEKTREVINKEQQYRFLLQNMREGIQVIGFDWKYLYVNNSAVEQNNFPAGELLGHTIMEKFPGIENTELFKVLQRCMTERKAEIFENTFTLSGGAQKCFELSIQPVQEGLFILSMDNTDRKKSERLLKINKQRLDIIFDTTTDIIFLLTIEDNRYLFASVNQAFLTATGLDKSQVIGKYLEEIVPEPSFSVVFEKYNEAIRNKTTSQWEETSPYPSGLKTGIVSITPLFNDSGQCNMVVGTVHDITELKKAEEKLKRNAEELIRSNSELERFAYIASHDLQEPLRMVHSFLKLLEKRTENQLDETSKQYMDFAVDGADRMKVLINDLLLYSRAGNNNNRENFTLVDLNEVMNYTCQVLEEKIIKYNIHIIQKPLPKIPGNKTLISQLFANLVGNAIKYHGDKPPEIEVGCNENPESWNVYIKDNGIGIDSQHYAKIFVIFQRLHTREEYSGTGIGLAICKKIIETHEGKIWVESQVGKGSTFHFSIPKTLLNELRGS